MENHLVISAMTKDLDLAQVVRHFTLRPIRSYIFTRPNANDEYALYSNSYRFSSSPFPI